jgi:hypothetical protein
MNNQSSNLPVEAKIRQVVQSVEPGQEFSESLFRKIMEQPRPEPSHFRRFQWVSSRPLWAGAILLLLALSALMLIGPYQVLAAIQNLLVYIPGIGFIQNGNGTLYLAQPLTTERAGIILTIDQVVADEEHSVIAYHFENLPRASGSEAMVCFYDDNKIRLPNGKLQPPIGGGVTGSQARIEYPPLPAGVNQITLLVSMAMKDPACSAPVEWSVDIPLGPLPPRVTLMPVYEGQAVQPSQPTKTALPTTVQTALPAKTTETADIQLVINRVAVLEEGYLVAGHALWNNKDWKNVSVFPDFTTVHISDADGKDVSFETSDEIDGEDCFAYKIKGKNYRSPLVLKIGSFVVNGTPAALTTFSFEAGEKPQTGQSWNLNRELDILGQKITIRNIKVVQLDDSSSGKKIDGYSFEIQTSPNMNVIDFLYNGTQKINQSFSQSRDLANNIHLLEIGYPEGIPDGTVSYQVGSIFYNLPGSWQVEWQIPGASQP